MPVDPEELRAAMRQWATGVTVVSAEYDGVRHGMTVSSFTSVSLAPPLVLVSLERAASTHQLVKQAGHFGVTILSQGQQLISDRFAGRIPGLVDRFAGLETFTLASGTPLLVGGLAAFVCRVVVTYTAANHSVFIGEVLAVHIGQPGTPLLYYDRDYGRLER
jgi:flavin reductase (DIM6/NTAB) family NADH-FMN oxidoreductase RutF